MTNVILMFQTFNSSIDDKTLLEFTKYASVKFYKKACKYDKYVMII